MSHDRDFIRGALYGAAFFALCTLLLGPWLGPAVYAAVLVALVAIVRRADLD